MGCPSNPNPQWHITKSSQSFQRAQRAHVHHNLITTVLVENEGLKNLLPGHKKLFLVLTLRASLDLGESLHTHINIHSYTAPPHATRRVLLVTFRSLLTSQLGPDCGWWVLRNVALSYFGLALQSTETSTPQLSCAFSAAQEGADPNRSTGASSMEEKRKDLPTFMRCSSFGLSFSWVQPLISAEWNFCGGEDLERNQWTTSQIKIIAGIIAGHKRESISECNVQMEEIQLSVPFTHYSFFHFSQ